MRPSKKKLALARDLLRRLEDGPAFSHLAAQHLHSEFDPSEAKRQYQVWSQSWLVEQFKELIPEVKEDA